MHLLSQIYAWMYRARQRAIFGLALSNWIIGLLLVLFFIGFAQRWAPALSLAFLLLAVSLIAAYWLVSRMGYKRFVADEAMTLDEEFAAPQDEHRVPLRATGVFSVTDYEGYVVEQPAEYWRVPLGHHVLMVQNGPGQYLYQIVEPENIRDVEPGYLHFGPRPQKALALHFVVNWGPEFAHEPRFYETHDPQPRPEPKEERTVYFTFDNDADRHAVWRNLLRRE